MRFNHSRSADLGSRLFILLQIHDVNVQHSVYGGEIAPRYVTYCKEEVP